MWALGILLQAPCLYSQVRFSLTYPLALKAFYVVPITMIIIIGKILLCNLGCHQFHHVVQAVLELTILPSAWAPECWGCQCHHAELPKVFLLFSQSESAPFLEPLWLFTHFCNNSGLYCTSDHAQIPAACTTASIKRSKSPSSCSHQHASRKRDRNRAGNSAVEGGVWETAENRNAWAVIYPAYTQLCIHIALNDHVAQVRICFSSWAVTLTAMVDVTSLVAEFPGCCI